MWNTITKGFKLSFKIRRSIVRARKMELTKLKYPEFDPYKALKIRFNFG